MKVKVDDIQPSLPGETLRKVDRWLQNNFIGVLKPIKYWVPALDENGYECGLDERYSLNIPSFTTSVNAALGLYERMEKPIRISSTGQGRYYVERIYFTDGTEFSVPETADNFLDLPCAIIRALLGSQNISEVEI